MKAENILSLFHHIHHKKTDHEVHHCGGKHQKIDSTLEYTIFHCTCGKHSIDKEKAIGHATASDLSPIAIDIIFTEKCPESGWHIESGKIA